MSTHTYTRERRAARALKYYTPQPIDAELTAYKFGGAL